MTEISPGTSDKNASRMRLNAAILVAPVAGIIAGLITQGRSPEDACRAGVYLHGAAADSLVETIGPYGYLAGDVMDAIPGEIKKILVSP